MAKTTKPKQPSLAPVAPTVPQRPPVVVVMGHVDHGKTTLLDTIRKTNVAQKEAGLITQHIGAYQVTIPTKEAKSLERLITFIDTPGHAAFETMRARGANVADIAILVVAADDSVKPQTVEAIKHIKHAGIPMIVAINKIDLPSSDSNRVKKDLATHEVFVEGYGGDTVVAEISAKTGAGVEDLLEVIGLVADIEELLMNQTAPVVATVIESRLDVGRGAVATVIVQQGTIFAGQDYYSEGEKFRIRALLNDLGQQVKEALPSTPVEITGLPKVPAVGTQVTAAPQAQAQTNGDADGKPGFRLHFAKTNEVPVLLRADVAGSLEAIVEQLKSIPQEGTSLRIVSAKIGDISESDILFAKTTSALVLGFNVHITAQARIIAQTETVPYKIYTIIYELLDDLQVLIETGSEILEPKPKGLAEVIALFPAENKVIAGVKMLEGRFRLGEQLQVLRNKEKVGDGRIKTMRRVKEDVKEISKGMEAGIVVDGAVELSIGDVLQYSP